MSELRLPSHLGLRCEKGEDVVRCYQKTVAKFSARFGRVIVCLLV